MPSLRKLRTNMRPRLREKGPRAATGEEKPRINIRGFSLRFLQNKASAGSTASPRRTTVPRAAQLPPAIQGRRVGEWHGNIGWRPRRRAGRDICPMDGALYVDLLAYGTRERDRGGGDRTDDSIGQSVAGSRTVAATSRRSQRLRRRRHAIRDRSTAGHRALNAAIEVRVLVPELSMLGRGGCCDACNRRPTWPLLALPSRLATPWAASSTGRAPVLQAGGWRFEAVAAHFSQADSSAGERLSDTQETAGSTPAPPTSSPSGRMVRVLTSL